MAKLIIDKTYGVAPNELLNDKRISLKAKGLFTFMQSKPGEWNFSTERTAALLKEGVLAVRSALKELEEFGYLERKPSKKENGKWCGYDYYLYDSPSCGKPIGRSTNRTGNHEDISKQEVVNKNIVKKNNTSLQKNNDVVSHGDTDINWVLDEFERVTGMKSLGTGKKDRFMAKHLLNNFTHNQITAMLMFCSTGDKYAPRVGSVEKLWYKRADIVAAIRAERNDQSKQANVVSI